MKKSIIVILLISLNSCITKTESPSNLQIQDHLSQIIESELLSKEIPAFSIALVEDQQTIWSQGFGMADKSRNIPAKADTVYRVGSVSKLFTDIAILQLMERNELNLDSDISAYLPDLSLENPFDTPVTLRQLMSHRAGLIREPRVGNYFDPSEPTLQATIESLNGTQLVYEPETRVKYSNAGIAIVGYIIEKTTGIPFTEYVKTNVLDPLGMFSSDFELNPTIQDKIAAGQMWTYDGRVFDAPTFQLGMSPAGSLYSSVSDLALFMNALFRGGGEILQTKTLNAMYERQFTDVDPSATYGIGFAVSDLEENRLISHGGAIYGFSTELAFIPELKLGVVAVASKDFSNAVVTRITRHALEILLAKRKGAEFPEFEKTKPLDKKKTKQLAEKYDLIARDNRLFLEEGSQLVEIKSLEGNLIVDSILAFGTKVDTSQLLPRKTEVPNKIPERWEGLIGEYGWDHNTLFVLEKNEKLHALIEWFEFYPLEELDNNRFAFPNYGLYHGEELYFERNEDGYATAVTAAGVHFDRRNIGTKAGETFTIQPQHPIQSLRETALNSTPPAEQGTFRTPELVEPTTIDPTIRMDIRYATTNNFMQSVFYKKEAAFLQRPAAKALTKAHRALADKGYGILIYDGYRPWHVTKMFYDATPKEQKIFVADPTQGSRHNRGAAVDLTLYELSSGEPVEMVGGYDEFSARSFSDYPGGTSRQRFLRELLRNTLEAEGFQVYEFEWWHFDHQEWQNYPISNKTFEQLLETHH